MYLDIKEMAIYYSEGKVLIRAYIGKPGDTVVDDHTDEEIVSIVRKRLKPNDDHLRES